MPALTTQERYNSERILNAYLNHDYITASDRALQMGIMTDLTKVDNYCMAFLPDLAVEVKGAVMFPPSDDLDQMILDYALISCLFSREFN